MHCKQTSNIAAPTISKSCTTNHQNMTNSNQRIQLYTDEEAMLAAGAEMISKKHMKAVGILAPGSGHLDNPILLTSSKPTQH